MRETRNLEFKEVFSDSFLKTVSAYANGTGGRILFGVDDPGSAKGVDDPVSLAMRVENKINDSLDPVPPFSIGINDASGVVTLSVDEGAHKPYLYRSYAYKRSDSSTVKVDRLELTRLILEGQHRNFEDVVARTEGLSFTLLEHWLQNEMGIERLSQDTLKTLELFSEEHGYNIAGELLADCNGMPGIDAVRFGDSVSQLLERMTSEKVSVLKQYQDALDMFRRNYVREEVRGSSRRTVELIPLEAFREAVANALVHRTWDLAAHVKISMYPDRVEVVSPGGLPSAISEEEYLRGRVSLLRNPILGNVFYRLGIIERFGTGVPRINEVYAESLSKPVFEISEHAISVVLPVVSQDLGLSTAERALLDCLDGGRELSSIQLAESIGLGKTKTVELLNGLKGKGLVVVMGSGRSTRYRAR